MELSTALMSMTIALFMLVKHPLFLVILLMAMTLLIMNHIMLISQMSWIVLILFLVFLGGLLIIFTYLSSLVPNEISLWKMPWILLMMNPIIMTPMIMPMNINHTQKSNLWNMINVSETSSLMMFLSYLLVTLVVTMIMAQYLKSPLCQSNY